MTVEQTQGNLKNFMFAKNRFLLPLERSTLPFIKPLLILIADLRVGFERSHSYTYTSKPSKLAQSADEAASRSPQVWAPGSRQGQLTSSSPAGVGGAPGCKCAASTSGTAGPRSRGDRRLTGKCKRETTVSGHWPSTRRDTLKLSKTDHAHKAIYDLESYYLDQFCLWEKKKRESLMFQKPSWKMDKQQSSFLGILHGRL